jgi:hypothetical protein
MLLRNSFFKSCGFNTNIQKWFDDAFGGNKPEYIKDMFGRNVKVADIKLITTPSSLKFLKFVDEFSGDEKKCYEKWLESISEVFGVCKSENPSPFGEKHQLSYQIVNTLPLSEADIRELVEDDFKHIKRLRNDCDFFRDNFMRYDPLPSDVFMAKLLEVNKDMWNTQLVKDFVSDKVENYINNLRKGRIKVQDSDYAVLFGNPFEMLQYATQEQKDEDKLIRPLEKGQIYCSRYDDGEELAGFRHPHITMGNVFVAKNVYKKEFDKYFNLTKNIIIFSPLLILKLISSIV